MNKEKVLMSVLFGLLAFLNINGYLIINERSVFGLTFGALIISISTCFDFPQIIEKEDSDNLFTVIKSNKYKIIQTIMYSLGFLSMYIIIFIKSDTIIDTFMKKFDSNTLMLMSISITFLSITVSNVNTNTYRNNIRKYYLDLFEKRIDEIETKLQKKQREEDKNE